jgi:hypothetical protein
MPGFSDNVSALREMGTSARNHTAHHPGSFSLMQIRALYSDYSMSSLPTLRARSGLSRSMPSAIPISTSTFQPALR